jgi:hypothetical protein
MNVVGIPLAHVPTKKKAHATSFVIFRFFFYQPIQEGECNPSWFFGKFDILLFSRVICP